jgi:hypothetical protein
LIWLYLDRAPANWDDAWYLTNSLVLFDALTDSGLPGFVRRFFTILGGTKAPLITALPTPVYLVFGRDPAFALTVVNSASIVAMLAAIYFIGYKLANTRTAILAVAISGTMPLLYGLAHWYLVEIPMTALLCISIALLIESDHLVKTWAVVAVGITTGLGLLLKISYPLYFFPVFSYVVVRHAFAVGDNRKVLRTFATFMVLLFAVAGPWYLLNYRTAISTAWWSAYSASARATWGTGEIFSPGAIAAYLRHVVQNGVSEFYAVLTIVVGLYLAIRRSVPMSTRTGWVCGLWLLPFFVFLFGANKDIRFLAPLLPGFALMFAAMLDTALRAKSRGSSLLLCVLLAWPFISMFRTSFGVLTPARDLGYARRFNPERWPHQEILNACISSLDWHPGQQATLLVGTDKGSFNANNFELAAVRSRFPLRIISSAYASSANAVMNAIGSASFVLFEEGGPKDSEPFNQFRSVLISEARTSGRFQEMYSHRLPDEGVARLFKRTTRELSVRSGLEFVGRSIATGELGHLREFMADFGDEIRLEGLALVVEPGSLRVTYGWRCLKPPTAEYWCFTHVVDENGAVVAYLDHPILAGDPGTHLWRVGDVATEQLRLRDSAFGARVKYRLRLGLFEFSSGRRLPVSRIAPTRSWSITLVDGSTGILAQMISPDATSAVTR